MHPEQSHRTRIKEYTRNGTTYGEVQEGVYNQEKKKSEWRYVKSLGKKLGTDTEGNSIFATKDELEQFYVRHRKAVRCLESGDYRSLASGEIDYLSGLFDSVIEKISLSDALSVNQRHALLVMTVYGVLNPTDSSGAALEEWYGRTTLCLDVGQQSFISSEVLLEGRAELLRQATSLLKKVWDARDGVFVEKIMLEAGEEMSLELTATVHNGLTTLSISGGNDSLKAPGLAKKPFSTFSQSEKEAYKRCTANYEASRPMFEVSTMRVRNFLGQEDELDSISQLWMLAETLRLNVVLEAFLEYGGQPPTFSTWFRRGVERRKYTTVLVVNTTPLTVFEQGYQW